MAAGLGFKTFTTGEVLTANDTNGYLMQGVLVFASSAARASAITSPQEGQYSYLKDTNSTEYYDGAAWIAAPIGDITGVTAGTGISGGGTSGTVTITNSMATEITAAGDIIVGTGSGTFDNIPIGTTGQVLTADTTVSPYKVKWASASSGFKGCAATASYSPTPSTSPFVISFASETFDTDGFHSTSSNTSRLTIPTGLGGYYQINAHYDAVSYNWGYSVGFLYVNGVKAGTTYGVDADQFARNNSSGNTINISAILKLSAADYVELFATTDQTSAGTVKAFLQCVYLGA